jgi:hypothetical protein
MRQKQSEKDRSQMRRELSLPATVIASTSPRCSEEDAHHRTVSAQGTPKRQRVHRLEHSWCVIIPLLFPLLSTVILAPFEDLLGIPFAPRIEVAADERLPRANFF